MAARDMKVWNPIAAPVALGLAGAGAWVTIRDAPQGSLGRSILLMPVTVDASQVGALCAQSCAACHGANLESQPGWQAPDADGRMPAPPHGETGHTWHHPERARATQAERVTAELVNGGN